MPENCLPPPSERKDWMSGNPTRLEQSGKAACAQCWIYLTYARLHRCGVPVELVHSFPEEGIVIALTGNILPDYRAPEKVFLVGVAADGAPHPSAHFHILQNRVHASRLPRSTYIPLWPQPGLIPRSQDRHDRFENLVFYGDPPNLAPELRDPAFADRLKSRLGISFRIASSADWHDYSQTDCVLAVRKFGNSLFLKKPATKLYNAWLAGVPFIGGSESAFSADGRPGVDFLQCANIQQVESALRSLQESPDLRHRIVSAGRDGARRFDVEHILARWRKALEKVLPDAAASYFSKHPSRKILYEVSQRAAVVLDTFRGFE